MYPQAPRRRASVHFGELSLGRKHRPDYWLIILCAMLLAIGLVVVYAIGPALSQANHVSSNYYVTKQLLAIALSFVAFVVTAQVPLSWWRQAYKPILVVAGLATLMAMLLPVNPAYPAHRWVRLGSFSFQSVEVAKFAVMLWLAGFLGERIRQGQVTDFNLTLKPILAALAAIGLVVAGVQSDLGSTGVMVIMMASMAFVAGLPLRRIAMISGVIVIGLILLVSAIPYRRARLETFLHPESNCQTTGYQACQALISVGSGGLIGLGLGSSVQAYGYQPEAANDSIFAIYAEKFGFVGSVVLLGVFVAFFARIKSIAERLDDRFTQLLVVGILAWFSTQALINIGGMIGLLPLKGITLPFISYGGTSVVFAAAAVGLIFQASQYTAYSTPRLSHHDDPKRVPGDYRNNTLRRPQ
ncbi:MAG TPA: putative peptidoglycan glycosyltransferase FtsW [Candidatus Saccharimonadales bacterium]|nr:putative peptidoglycan glycosyltransferase FtsW [Candidatus Saccharimonadales bacterium]